MTKLQLASGEKAINNYVKQGEFVFASDAKNGSNITHIDDAPTKWRKIFRSKNCNISEPPTNSRLIVKEFLAELPTQRSFFRVDLESIHVKDKRGDKNKSQRIR